MVRASIPCPRQLQCVPYTHGTLGERPTTCVPGPQSTRFPQPARGPQQQYLQMGIFLRPRLPQHQTIRAHIQTAGSLNVFANSACSRCAVASLYAVLGTQLTCGVGWWNGRPHRCTPGNARRSRSMESANCVAGGANHPVPLAMRPIDYEKGVDRIRIHAELRRSSVGRTSYAERWCHRLPTRPFEVEAT